jgi:mediator of RNA polymerase II transcription subunit 16
MVLPSIVLSVSIVRQYTMMAFAMSDGSVQFRFRESLDLASADGSYEEVQSLPQAGFSFPVDEPALYSALSPSACCAVVMNADGDVKLRKMTYTVGDVTHVKEDDAHFGAFAAIFALYWMTAWLNYTTVDDLLAIFPTYMSQALPSEAIIQSCVAIGPHSTFDFVVPNQQIVAKLFSSGLLDKILGAYCGLFTQRGSKLAVPAKLSWIALNLRLLANNMAGYNTATTAGKQSPAEFKPEFQFVLGMIRWMQDAQTFVIQELMDMAYDLGEKITDKAAMEAWIRKHNSCGMHLMLCSLTRFLLRNTLRTLKRSYDIATLVLKTKRNDQATVMYWTAYFKQFQSFALATIIYKDDPADQPNQPNKPPALKPLEQFIVDVDAAIKKCYSQVDERRRGVIERDMFLRCEIPDVLVPAAAFMLRRALDFKTMQGVSEYAIWGQDVAWLGVTDEGGQGMNGGGVIGKNGIRVDVIRKVHLGPSKSVRSCPRCGSVAEEFAEAQPNGFPSWLTKSTRTCVCSDNWCVQEEEVDGHKNGV